MINKPPAGKGKREKMIHFVGSHNYNLPKGAILTIGNFDGVHLGHRRLIDTVIHSARQSHQPSVLYTFSPHPVQFLFPERKHKLLYSFEKTKEIVSTLDLDCLIVEPFTDDFSKLLPEEFIEKHIVSCIQPKLLVVGYNFRFGINNLGSVELIKKMGEKYDFRVKVVGPVKKEGKVISSSLIKETILSGNWHLVPSFLDRFFSIKGLVVKGKGRGQKMGFPTINLQVDKNVLLPVNGVYTARVKKKSQFFYAVVNIGTNPTFSKNCLKKIEVHLIERAENWQEKECEVEILEKIRSEKKFPGPKELVHQIKKDIEYAKKYFHSCL